MVIDVISVFSNFASVADGTGFKSRADQIYLTLLTTRHRCILGYCEYKDLIFLLFLGNGKEFLGELFALCSEKCFAYFTK